MPKSSITFKPAKKISDLKDGAIVRHKNSPDSCVINGNYGRFAVATKTYVIYNPDEWMTIEEAK